ncbi:MAG TPA: hypothetical protein VGJ86_08080 [Acidimicrobiales bacterium]|jgi:hypothetical protein
MYGRWLAATAVVLLLGATSCSDDDDDTAESSSTSSTTTPTTVSPEAEVKTAYKAFADMGARLLQAPNPEDPEIAQRTSGEAQADLITGLTQLRDAGQHYELGPQYGQEVLSVALTDTGATGKVCVVEDSQLVASSGEVLAQGVTTVVWTVDLVEPAGTWFVDRIVEGEVQEGAVPCN